MDTVDEGEEAGRHSVVAGTNAAVLLDATHTLLNHGASAVGTAVERAATFVPVLIAPLRDD